MGICSCISTEWLFIQCFQVELEFRNGGFVKDTGEVGRKPLEQGKELTTNSTPGLSLLLVCGTRDKKGTMASGSEGWDLGLQLRD